MFILNEVSVFDTLKTENFQKSLAILVFTVVWYNLLFHIIYINNLLFLINHFR